MRVVGIEEAPVTIIERYGNVPADIFVSDDLALEDREEPLSGNALLTVSELKRLFFLKFGKRD
jgi:hypothetical protein